MKIPTLKIGRIMMALAITTAISLTSCSPKDSDIKAQVETRLNAKPDVSGAAADVKDGVVTLTGQCKSEASKADCEKTAQNVKGVKSVVNNLTVTPPPAVSEPVITITPDDPLTKSVTDATKDFPSVKADVKDGVITLTGDIKKSDLPKLMKSLHSLKPKKIENQLTIK